MSFSDGQGVSSHDVFVLPDLIRRQGRHVVKGETLAGRLEHIWGLRWSWDLLDTHSLGHDPKRCDHRDY